MPEPSSPERPSKGQLTRQTILREAVQIASEQGLLGLSIGRLAETTGMSKAGLFAHFGSKQGLQLATLQAARDIVAEEVFRPALKAPRGMRRLVAMLDRWLEYAETGIFRGGCPFLAASTEFDGRPGPVRDYVAETLAEFRQNLTRLVREAQQSGELRPEIDTGRLAFEFHALLQAANNGFQLHGDPEPIRTARAILLERLRASASANVNIEW
jgi:AcrR family transcriptional regulator